MFDPSLQPIITPIISAIVGAVVAAVVARIQTRGQQIQTRTEQEKAENAAMQAGMRALLWRELKTFHELSEEQDGLSIENRRHITDVYEAYHTLGGNGTGTRLFDDAMNSPVKND